MPHDTDCPDPGAPPIRLIYVRDPRADLEVLDGRLARIVARYAPMVDLEAVSPWELPPELADHAGPGPSVLILRHGQLVGGAAGAAMPARELDRVVRCAVEWTA
jgi:hypothetical protein